MFEFGKNLVVDTTDSVPEEYRSLYVEGQGDNKGKFVLSDAVKSLAVAHDGVNTRLNQVSKDKTTAGNESAKRRQTIKAIADIFTEFGVDVGDIEQTDVVGKLKETLTDWTSKVKSGKDLQVNLDKIKTDYQKRLDEANATNAQTVTAMKNSLEGHLIGQAAATALADAKVVQNGVELLMPQIKQAVKVVQDETGQYVVRVVDAQGDARSDGKGGWMTVKDYVAEIKQKFPTAFLSDSKSGTDKKPISGNPIFNSNSDEKKSSFDLISEGLKARNK